LIDDIISKMSMSRLGWAKQLLVLIDWVLLSESVFIVKFFNFGFFADSLNVRKCYFNGDHFACENRRVVTYTKTEAM
jgi:hypothetical protein